MDSVVTIAVIAASTVIVVAVIICVGCLYNKYLRWFQLPSVHPADHSNAPTEQKSSEEIQTDASAVSKQNGTLPTEVNKPEYLNLPDGRIIKPQVCISQEMLSMYRMSWQSGQLNLAKPPRKVKQLYKEETMMLFQRDFRNTFKILNSPQHTRSKITASQSQVNSGSTLTKQLDVVQDIRLAMGTAVSESHNVEDDLTRPETFHPDVNDMNRSETDKDISDTDKDKSDADKDKSDADKATRDSDKARSDTDNISETSGFMFTERPHSNISCYSGSILNHFVGPGDVDLDDL